MPARGRGKKTYSYYPQRPRSSEDDENRISKVYPSARPAETVAAVAVAAPAADLGNLLTEASENILTELGEELITESL